MVVAFLDESGYSKNWQVDASEQPFYVLAAILLPAGSLAAGYKDVRDTIQSLNLPGQEQPLGQGFEIKARDIARGYGWWGQHEAERNQVRDLMLSFPSKLAGVSFVVVVDKMRHISKYVWPEDPHSIALTFIMERIGQHLSQSDETCLCVYDHNKAIDTQLASHAGGLIRDGSVIRYYSDCYDAHLLVKRDCDRIVEFAFGDSRYSIGLQVADFFASMAYRYFKDGKPTNCGWWDSLSCSLWSPTGRSNGYGLKVFP